MQAIRGMLGSKYGKEYIAEASSDTYCRKWVVNENLIRRACTVMWQTGSELRGSAEDLRAAHDPSHVPAVVTRLVSGVQSGCVPMC